MLRVIVLLTAIGLAAGAPALKDKTEGPYFPTKKGDTRVYESRCGDAVSEYTEVVTNVEQRKDHLRVSCGRVYEGTVPYLTTIEVSEQGVYCVIAETASWKTTIPILKFPLKPSETWTVEQGTEGFGLLSVKKTYKIRGVEEIEVAAGKFRTIRIDYVEEIGEARFQGKQWHAAGVGLVKSVNEAGEHEHILTLKSFKPGR